MIVLVNTQLIMFYLHFVHLYENKLCLIVLLLPTHMNDMNGTDGVASHSF